MDHTAQEDQLRQELQQERAHHNQTTRKLIAAIRQSQKWRRRCQELESLLERVASVTDEYRDTTFEQF